jgi:hypothetical protein
MKGVRWAAAAWLAVWVPAYWWHYGPLVFLNLCDIAVILTCVGLWRGSALLLSSQALSSLAIDLAWVLDLAFRAATGRHLIGGTEYMWDPAYPAWLRALSLFHVLLPAALLWALPRVGYDRRALAVQSAIALAVLALSRATSPELNVNFAFRDPIFGRAWGPAALHVLAIFGGLFAVYWLTGLALRRAFPPPQRGGASSAA